MKYIVTSEKSVDDVCKAMETAVPDHKFGIVGIHDLKATMAKKGVEYDDEVRVFEVCNPHKAKAVLDIDPELSMALPCRICVYTQEGETKIGMLEPVKLLQAINADHALVEVASEVENASKAIIEQVK